MTDFVNNLKINVWHYDRGLNCFPIFEMSQILNGQFGKLQAHNI